ncbi:MAG: hypothetical protein H6621_11315 [Halobacteriovoraceae bacterium]|nr:hypothetical protein [Halobacteriovoraceae bacterium]MCB9095648.1 hypothetical protein [Halobacteriovoraceae bacterium]
MSNNGQFAIIGAGNQAFAWALNLRDSRFPFSVGIRKTSSAHTLLKDKKIPVFDLGESLRSYKSMALLIPDDQHAHFFENYSSFLEEGTQIIYAHSYSLVEDQLAQKYPQFEHVLLAPKSIGSQIRYNFERSRITPAVYSLDLVSKARQNQAQQEMEILCHALGFSLLAQVRVEDETIADLFSEQTLLCGFFPYIISECFQLLKDQGIDPTLSFLECWHESKLIIDTLVEKGPEEFFKLISPNALIGAHEASQVLIDENFKKKLSLIFEQIKNKDFNQKIKNTDYQELKNSTINFWKNTDLQKFYNQYSQELYPVT